MLAKMVDFELAKVYGFSLSAFAVSLTDIDLVLKMLLVVVSIGYTATKWWRLMQEDRTSDEDLDNKEKDRKINNKEEDL